MTWKNMHKFLTLFLALTLVLSLFTMSTLTAFAEGSPATPTDLGGTGDGEGEGGGDDNPPPPTTYNVTFKYLYGDYTSDAAHEGSFSSSFEHGEALLDPGASNFETLGHRYEFTGWSPELVSPVVGDATYTAQYTISPIEYEITWKDDEGEVVDTTYVAYGETPSHAGIAKQGNEQWCYSFAGWTPDIVAVTGDATYTASFNKELQRYTIYWCDETGENVIQEQVAEYGTMPSFLGNPPVKEPTKEVEFVFDGWTPSVEEIKGDAYYNIKYKSVPRKYPITWKYLSSDGTSATPDELSDTEDCEFGSELPEKKADNFQTLDKVYTFTGWTPEVVSVGGEATYTATYEITPRMYTVTWVLTEQNEDGELYEVRASRAYAYGASLEGEFPAVTKTFYTEDEIYVFEDWSPAPQGTVIGNLVFTAVYKSRPIIEPPTLEYAITWKDDAGEVIDITMVEYGETPTHDDPKKAATAQYTYDFAGWTPEVVPATENATYTATFKSTVNRYTVYWCDESGENVIQEQVIEYGETPAYVGDLPTKAATAQYTYDFAGWTPEVVPVTGDAIYKATFKSTVNRYTVYWVFEDKETILQEQVVEYGVMPAYVGDLPTKAATKEYTYTFAGWTPEVVPVTGDAIYVATFVATAIPPQQTQPPLTPPERSAKMNRKFKVYYGETPDPLEKQDALVVEWGQASGVATYEIYAYFLDEEVPTTPRVSVNYGAYAVYVTDINDVKVDPTRCYAAYVVAKNRKGEEVGRTVIAYVAGPESEYTNPATLTVTSEKSIKLGVGQSSAIQAAVTLEDSTKPTIPGIPDFRYASTKESVATVTESGEIVAVGKGSCIIQVYSKNGLVDEIKVTVK